MVFHLDTTGKSGIGVAYDLQDLDNSADDQPQRVALQYRVGTSGAYTNVPAGYVADATVASKRLPPGDDRRAGVLADNEAATSTSAS